MSGFVRKNLMVDADELRQLATSRGTSESAAVREAIRMALAGQEMVDAMQALHDLGAFEDFDQLYGEIPPPGSNEPADPT
jgi:DNA-binding GntR family transcriptional regulator